ncbi:hypothetical protein ABWK22_02170 [Gottfriedia acidiceleris]|uniref:hypothetical protein n=1 Tax=Gottfriedia acidiceleris TaxID=371036 RepID=UPI003395B1E2
MNKPLMYQLLEEEFMHVYKHFEKFALENEKLRKENEQLKKIQRLLLENQLPSVS